MRGDPGGLVNEAVGVAGVFLPDASEVVVTEGLHSPRRVFRSEGTPAAGDLPLVVLVDRGSASASEIVAGALRDADRAELVGERTFGKALVQSTRPLRDGGALKLTTARYLTPDGFDLAARGLPPDVRVVDDPATPRRDEACSGVALSRPPPLSDEPWRPAGGPGLRAGARRPRRRVAGVRAGAADPAGQGAAAARRWATWSS